MEKKEPKMTKKQKKNMEMGFEFESI